MYYEVILIYRFLLQMTYVVRLYDIFLPTTNLKNDYTKNRIDIELSKLFPEI